MFMDDDAPLSQRLPRQYAIPVPDRLYVDTLVASSTARKAPPFGLTSPFLSSSRSARKHSSAPSINTAPRSAVAARPPPKTIAQVLGSGRKVRKQKGMARAGYFCVPQCSAPRPTDAKTARTMGAPNSTITKSTDCHLDTRSTKKRCTKATSWCGINVMNYPHTRRGEILLPWDFSSALILEKILTMTTKMTMPLEPWCAFNLWMAAATFAVHQVRSDHDAAMYTISKHETLVLMLAAVERLESRLRGELH